MQTIYEHRQVGTVILLLIGIPTIGWAAVVLTTGQPGSLLPLMLILAFMLAVMVTFSSMTVRVDADAVRLHFGPGVFRRALPLDQVAGVRVVRNTLLMGLGIHFIRGGLIYNVSGLDGVEITLKNGRVARIGSEEPAVLARAIEQAQNRQS